MNCGEARPDLVALVQEELDPERSGEIRAHLRSCPSCLEEERNILDTLNLTRLVRMDRIDPPVDVLDRIRDRLDEEPMASPFPAASPPASSNRTFAWAASAALLLCVAAGATLLLNGEAGTSPGDVGARLSYLSGEAFVVDSSGTPTSLSPGSRVEFGVDVRVRGVARFDLRDGVRMALRDGIMVLRRERGFLHEGKLAVEVRTGMPFAVRTPHGEVRVEGTRFILETAQESTRVHVVQGRVGVRNGSGRLSLQGGESGRLTRDALPSRTEDMLDTAWARVLSVDILFLRLRQPDPARPALLEFRMTNVSDRVLHLPRFNPDRPDFSLGIRTGTPPREGLVNLSRFLVPGENAFVGENAGTVRIFPGRTVSLRFDVSSLLWMPGRYEVSGIYQAAREGVRGRWVGQVLSLWTRIEIEEGK